MRRLICLCLGLVLISALFCQNAELKPVVESLNGSIKVISQYGGNLYLDGEFYQSLMTGSSANWADISAGVHTVQLSNSRTKETRTVLIIASKVTTVNFDEPAEEIAAETPASEPQIPTETKPEKLAKPDPPRKPIIKNYPDSGKGSLQVKSFISGDIYLGGIYLGSVVEGKNKKFSALTAGEYTLELMHQFFGVSIDLQIYDKRDNAITIAAEEGIPYPRGMVYLPGGEYMMGSQFVDRSDYERPRHEVELPPFLIAFTEVTQELWNEVMDYNPSARSGNKLPVTNVSWYEALNFCNALSRKDGLEPCYVINKDVTDANNTSDIDTLRYQVYCKWTADGYRLPTEAEWEYASRSGDSLNKQQFSGSKDADIVAWYSENSNYHVQEVATKEPNLWGLFDFSGNVYEWCWDFWGTYGREAQIHPKGAISGAYRIARGGSWMSDVDPCISTARTGFSPHSSSKELGLRIARKARAN